MFYLCVGRYEEWAEGAGRQLKEAVAQARDEAAKLEAELGDARLKLASMTDLEKDNAQLKAQVTVKRRGGEGRR